jgi:hypothetical protein
VKTGSTKRILKRKPDKLRLGVTEQRCPTRRSFRTNDLTAILDVREMLLGNSEPIRKLRLGHGLALSDGSQELGKRERSTTQLFEECHSI